VDTATVDRSGYPTWKTTLLQEEDEVWTDALDAAWAGRVPLRMGDVEVMVIGREELIQNKRAVGRPRDITDVVELEGS